MNEVRFSSNGIEPGYENYGTLSDSSLEIYDCRLCDLVVIDPEGRRVIPSMTYSEPTESKPTGSTIIDLSQWSLTSDVWRVIPVEVQKGKSADPKIEEEDFFTLLFSSNSKSKFLSRMISSPFPTPNIQEITILGTHFYASGQEQLVNGQIVERLLPAFGSFRQWVGVNFTTKESFHHFQVFQGSNLIWDRVQDSLDFQSDPNNKGEKFYFPENLPAYNQEQVRLEYSWKVRVSFKNEVEGVMEWSEWSALFPFKINVPPSPPTELEVKSNEE